MMEASDGEVARASMSLSSAAAPPFLARASADVACSECGSTALWMRGRLPTRRKSACGNSSFAALKLARLHMLTT